MQFSPGRTNGFTKNVLCQRGSRQSRGRQSDASPIRSAVLPAAAAARLGRWADGPGVAAASWTFRPDGVTEPEHEIDAVASGGVAHSQAETAGVQHCAIELQVAQRSFLGPLEPLGPGRIVNVCVVVLISTASRTAWLAFLRSLTARGLSGVELVTSDAHQGLKNAIAAVFTGASWQRCRTHFMANPP